MACANGILPYFESSDVLVHHDCSDHIRLLPNYNIEVTGSDMNIPPIGFPGEIYIFPDRA